MQERGLLEADVDERRLHAGQHAGDAALVDVPGDALVARPLDEDLDQACFSSNATRVSNGVELMMISRAMEVPAWLARRAAALIQAATGRRGRSRWKLVCDPTGAHLPPRPGERMIGVQVSKGKERWGANML